MDFISKIVALCRFGGGVARTEECTTVAEFDFVLISARILDNPSGLKDVSALNGKSRGIAPALCTKEEKSLSKWHGAIG